MAALRPAAAAAARRLPQLHQLGSLEAAESCCRAQITPGAKRPVTAQAAAASTLNFSLLGFIIFSFGLFRPWHSRAKLDHRLDNEIITEI